MLTSKYMCYLEIVKKTNQFKPRTPLALNVAAVSSMAVVQPIPESLSQFKNRITPRVYIRSIMHSTMY